MSSDVTYHDLVETCYQDRWAGTKNGERARELALTFPSTALSGRALDQWVHSLWSEGKAPATVNRRLAAVLTVWRHAVRRGVETGPVPEGRYLREDNRRERVLTNVELALIIGPTGIATWSSSSG